MTSEVMAARAALHFWEEPCISGTEGSGAVFFSGCTLRCVFCQNHEIAAGAVGKPVTEERLSRIFLELQEKGANNINLVTATQFLPTVIPALQHAKKKGLTIPIVYNTGGYEKVETLRLLEEDRIDIGLIGRPGKLSGYEFLPLLQIQDTFVATKQYLENQHRLFPLEPLSHTATFMLLDEQNITRQSVNIMLHDHQLQLGHILEVSSMDLLIQFAQVGLGIACVIKEFVQKELDEGALVEVPLGLIFPSREIGFVCRSGAKAQELVTSSQSLFI